MYGMLPPDFVSSDGSEKPQNPGQKYLWECWQDMKRKASEVCACESLLSKEDSLRAGVATPGPATCKTALLPIEQL